VTPGIMKKYPTCPSFENILITSSYPDDILQGAYLTWNEIRKLTIRLMHRFQPFSSSDNVPTKSQSVVTVAVIECPLISMATRIDFSSGSDSDSYFRIFQQ